jgi:uncharacterized protein with ParB-like and HNH nuclease domain
MSAISPHYRTVKDLLQSRSFAIDEYQREYKWEQKNIEELLSDLKGKFDADYQSGHATNKVNDYGEYFLGSIIVSQRNGKNYLVDGQQRVTSLTLLLIYLYRAARANGLNVSGTMAPLICSDDMGVTKFNLDIPERLPVIQALFDGTPFSPGGKDESIQAMHARFQDIEASELVEELGDGLAHFIYWLLNKVGLIEIATANDAYANAIFETMNDRGKPLSPVDMLKAYLLAPITDPAQRAQVNKVWKGQVLNLISWNGEPDAERDSNCMKAWLRAQHSDTIRERKAGSADKDWELIGTVFHRWVRDHHKKLGLGVADANRRFMADHFPFFADAWLKILNASKHYTPGLEAIYFNAHNEFTWQPTVLLAPLVESDNADVISRKMAVTATFLDIWLMRRVVNYVRVGYSAVSYAMWSLCKDIRRKSLPELVATLREKLDKDEVTFAGYPAKGRKGLSDFGLNQHSRRYLYHLLARVTAATEVGAGRADIFPALVDRTAQNPYDIEHIWPADFALNSTQFADENEFNLIRNHSASLLLLPADVNRSLQDKSFLHKRDVYAQQNFYAASLSANVYIHQPQFRQFIDKGALPFKPFNSFGKAEQAERLSLLTALASRIWSSDRLEAAANG